MDQEQQRDHKEEDFNRALLREEDESEQDDGNAHNNNSITLGPITYEEFVILAKNSVHLANPSKGPQLRDDLQALIARVNAYQQQLDAGKHLQPRKRVDVEPLPIRPKEQVKLASFGNEREWNPGTPPM